MGIVMETGMETGKRPLTEPRVGGSVWPGQCCPAFTARKAALAAERGCWYCKYADFHLKEPVSLDVGICCWPKVQIK